MKGSLSFIVFFCFGVKAQELYFQPSKSLENQISLNYYDTEYIFITNNSSSVIDLSFSLITADFPSEWSVTGCTNLICYTKIPEDGPFGIIDAGQQAYMSINLSTNKTAGNGSISFVILNNQATEILDTIYFNYTAATEENSKPQEWAKLNISANSIHIFVQNPSDKTTLQLFDLSGKQYLYSELETISSFSLIDLPSGIYIAVIRNESGKEIKEKIIKF